MAMKQTAVLLAAVSAALIALPVGFLAQDSSVITMDQEPHHHLVLHNDDVKIFDVHVAPGDSIVLHRHDQDTVAIAIGEQLVTVGVPGKPDVHQKNAVAQVRLQQAGYRHSTHVDRNTPYHTVAVELLRPQTNFHNLCAAILPDQPSIAECFGTDLAGPGFVRTPLLGSDQTRVSLVRVQPQQGMKLDLSSPEVMVTLDPAALLSDPDQKKEKQLDPGDFLWFPGRADLQRVYQNRGDKEARFIEIQFPPPGSHIQ
jgi:hypothetical protein